MSYAEYEGQFLEKFHEDELKDKKLYCESISRSCDKCDAAGGENCGNNPKKEEVKT